MKKIILIALAAVSVVSCGRRNRERVAVLSVSNDSLQTVLAARDSVLNEALFALSDISSSLSDIKRQEAIVVSSSELGKSDEAQIKEDLELLSQRLSDQRKAIARLNRNTTLLKEANINIAGLEKLITELQAQINERDTTIKAMLANIDDLNNQILILNTDLSNAYATADVLSATVDGQEAELNKAYVAIGTAKELIDRGILVRKGVGNKTLALNSALDRSEMSVIDIREVTSIDLTGKNAEIIGSFPETSYRFVEGEKRGTVTALEILDSAEFWKNSHVLVVTFKE